MRSIGSHTSYPATLDVTRRTFYGWACTKGTNAPSPEQAIVAGCIGVTTPTPLQKNASIAIRISVQTATEMAHNKIRRNGRLSANSSAAYISAADVCNLIPTPLPAPKAPITRFNVRIRILLTLVGDSLSAHVAVSAECRDLSCDGRAARNPAIAAAGASNPRRFRGAGDVVVPARVRCADSLRHFQSSTVFTGSAGTHTVRPS